MEAIFGLLGIWFFFWLLGVVLKHAGAATKAAANTITGKGTFSDNLELELKGMGVLEAQVVPTKVEISGTSFDALEVKIKGLINAGRVAPLRITTSIFDFTQGQYAPVLCSIDAFQEKSSRAYQNIIDAGEIRPNQGYPRWVKVATVFPQSLTGEYSGRRKLRFHVRALPPESVEKIGFGLHEKDAEIFSAAAIDYEVELQEKGYAEAAEGRQKAKAISVRIAVAVAMSGGSLTEGKARAIQNWIRREVEAAGEGSREDLKKVLNDSLRDAYAQAQKGTLAQDDLISRLKGLELKGQNLELLQLCIDVISVDGRIDAEGLRRARAIAAGLDIDYDEFQAMSDKKLLEMEHVATTDDSIETLLGIDSSWDVSRVKAHLRAEFIKWNGRIQALSEGSEKDQAQRMLDAIAAARTKYGSN